MSPVHEAENEGKVVRRTPRWGIALCLVIGAVVIPYLFLFWLRYGAFGGYLYWEQVNGTYNYAKDGLTERIVLQDGKFVQELRIGSAVYSASGEVRLNQGGGVILLGAWQPYASDGSILKPPEKDRGFTTRWTYSGELKCYFDYSDPPAYALTRTQDGNWKAWKVMLTTVPFFR